MATSASPYVGPKDFSKEPAWVWKNENDELFRHGPSIDGEGNVYIVTAMGWVRKFSPDGELIWTWRTTLEEGRIQVCLALHEGSIYFASIGIGAGGTLISLDMATGQTNWKTFMKDFFTNGDSHTTFITNGTVLLAGMDIDKPLPYEGNNKVHARSLADGTFLWDFHIDGAVWNFMPSTPGDGTILFSTHGGRAHRLDVTTGKLIWKAGFEEYSWQGTGGGALGPNGVFYAVSNVYGPPGQDRAALDMEPCSLANCHEGPGAIIAYQVSDGKILAHKRSHHMGMQYPAVGKIGDRLMVVAGMGQNPNLVHSIFEGPLGWVPGFGWLKRLFFELQLRSSWLRRYIGIPILKGAVLALDAKTLATVWSFDDEPFDNFAAGGDEERFFRNVEKQKLDHREEVMCGPDSWGIPIIAGDGTVYASSGTNGNLYAINDRDGNGVIDKTEWSVFRAGIAFLNAPALAPGMLAVAPCWGPMYVFKG